MVVLTINGIDCFYESVKVLKGIKFEVKTGEFLGILGPNGSGKTTLLRSISRVLQPQKGAVLIDGRDIYKLKTIEVAKQLAVVPQDTPVTFDFTSLEVVLMGRNPHVPRFKMESKEDLAIAKKSMELTGILHLADRPVTELSGGERQRVIIACALTQEPKILLLDEPTTHLDISNQLEIMDLLKKFCKTKKLLIISVFHDFNLAASYCNSIILLKEGEIVAVGKSDKTLTSENVKKVFNVDTIVKKHPATGSLHVIPIPRVQNQQKKRLSIHLICGGGTGSYLMRILKDEGYSITAGVLNLLDTDQETAQLLRIPTATEAPFSPITNEAHKANLHMINQADVLVITPTQFGEGNLRNLKAAEKAVEKGITTIILQDGPIEERDFTKGKAINHLAKLRNGGAIIAKDTCDLLLTINRLEDNSDQRHHQREEQPEKDYVNAKFSS